MGILDAPSGRGGQKRARGLARRRGIHLDMTPMVDVAFLLLTFFMLTTTFAKSNTVALNIPPENMAVRVAANNVLTLRIADDAMAYYSLGGATPVRLPLYDSHDNRQLALSGELRQLLKQQVASNTKTVIVLKISDKARYRALVDLIDELHLMKIERFTLDDFTEQDAREIQRTNAAMSKKVSSDGKTS
jgi:biopolymer transport protein ExbD